MLPPQFRSHLVPKLPHDLTADIVSALYSVCFLLVTRIETPCPISYTAITFVDTSPNPNSRPDNIRKVVEASLKRLLLISTEN